MSQTSFTATDSGATVLANLNANITDLSASFAPKTSPTFATSITGSYLTASEMLITDSSKNVVSAPVATYPSLTELSYVKGVTSALQTQINAKASAPSGTINEIAYFNSASTITSLAVATYPSLTELTYVKGVTSAIQTQLGTKITASSTDTLTNKRITKRVASTTDDATAVIDSDSYDEYYLTAIANATEISVTGTPTEGQTIFIGLKDAGVSKALTWTGITALGVTLPTATTAGKQHIIGIKYIASAWRAIAVGVEA